MRGLQVPETAISHEAPSHTLLDSAYELDAPAGWEQGVQLRDEFCNDISSWNPNCAVWPGGVKPAFLESGNTAPSGWDVFEIYTDINCTVGPISELDEWAAIAGRQLEVGRSKAVEYELWTGTEGSLDTGLTPNLQTGATVVGSAMSFSLGLAMAGHTLASCGLGTRGFIHAPTYVVGMWLAGNQLREDADGRLVTKVRGDVVVPGAGYPGTGVAGAAPAANQSWIFATGPVAYKLGEVVYTSDRQTDNVNRSTNDYRVRVSQSALVAFDPCCHAVILVDSTL